MSIIYILDTQSFTTVLDEKLCSCNTRLVSPTCLGLWKLSLIHHTARLQHLSIAVLKADLARLPLLSILFIDVMESQQITNSTVSGGRLAHTVAL
jgi:hypothetical protein